MGGSSSKTTVEQLSEQISNIAMSTVQNCEVSTQQSQNVTVENTGFKFWGKYRLEQQSEIRAECFNDVNRQVDLQNKIIAAVSQATTSQNVGILGAFGKSSSEAVTKLTSIVRNNVTMSNIQRSYNAIKQTQTARFSNSGVIGFESAELVQGARLFAAATLQEIDRAGVFNAIDTYVNQQSSSKVENPMDFISNMLGAYSGLIMSFVFVIIVAVAVFFGVDFFKPGPKKQPQAKPQPTEPQPQPTPEQ